jgi:hypothetical protein
LKRLGWLRRAAYAAQLASDRADLWPAGALAALVFAGWLPLLLVVAPLDPQDLAFVGNSLVSSSAYPANVVALSVAVVAAVMLACLLAAMAEAALQRMAGARPARQVPFGRAALTALAVVLVASIPAACATAALVLGIIAVAFGVFTSPDLDTPLLLRLAAGVWPFLLAMLVAVVVGQAFGGAALRRALAADAPPIGRALAAAAGDLRRHPVRLIGLAAAGLLKDAAWLVLSYALLRVLWAPIGGDLAAGQLASPDTLLLLVGFVAIWLALLLTAGALHVAVSAWWALELARADRADTFTGAEGAGLPAGSGPQTEGGTGEP